MSKYIIDLRPDCKVVQQICAIDKGINIGSRSIGLLDELTDEYVKKNFKDLLEGEYQRGLNDAWEAARKLFSSMAESDIEKAFPIEWNNGGFNALINLQPQEAIAKLKAYEKKQKADDKIKVGDVVMIKQFKHPENHLFVVTKVSDESVWGVEGDGSWNYWAINEVIKTDKHFDIDKILEGLRYDS